MPGPNRSGKCHLSRETALSTGGRNRIRWRERQRATQVLSTWSHTNHVTPCHACPTDRKSADGLRRCPRFLSSFQSSCGHLCHKSRPVTREQSAEGSKGKTCTKLVPQASAQAGFRAPRLPRSRTGLARGVAAFRGNAACPRGPPRPFRPFPSLHADRAADPASTRPSRRVAARKLPATLTPELRNRGGSADPWLQRRRGRARGGAGRGASTASAPLGNTLCSLPSFRKTG
ncbi:hypothetical protein HJG60_008972 [Phyllostomus discolor]|uniref:Uncharacterized protein n=1 Tax=Phyllostomus discolor TaxID=89673 RepID=A0A833YWW2_9CHIR|nr:hypothetical protein HJG60_008972 [Phyllostomus discolor]